MHRVDIPGNHDNIEFPCADPENCPLAVATALIEDVLRDWWPLYHARYSQMDPPLNDYGREHERAVRFLTEMGVAK